MLSPPHVAPLPLHMFEPCYREMIAGCLEKKEAFGVLRAKEKCIAELGYTAEIVNVAKQYPDGGSILSLGAQTF
jgi:Lon protease-like protein